MKKHNVLLSVALSAACLSGIRAASDQKLTSSLKGQSIDKNVSKNGAGTGSSQKPVWPDDTKVKCLGCNSCKGKGACKGASNSCAGLNPCKGKGWLETTAKECTDKKGTILGSINSNDSK